MKKLISVEDEIMKEGIAAIPNMNEAIKTALRQSGKLEKQFYWELQIDPAHWSRILNGQGHFPHDKLVQLCEIAGNDIPIQWLAHQRGYELRVIPKTLEDQLAKERLLKEELQRKYDAVIDALKLAGIKRDDSF